MRRLLALAAILLGAVSLLSASARQGAGGAPSIDDPEIRSVVDRFFATQVAEDANAYLALWSANVLRPTLAQLKFIFESGDDVFSDVTINRVAVTDGRIRVRVFATRNRVDSRNKRPDGTPFRYTTRLTLALALVREDGALKIVSEGSPADDLATAILQAPTAAARAALMDAEPDLVGEALVSALARSADASARSWNFAAARSGYDIVIEVARRAGSHKAEGQALQNIGNSAYFQRDFTGALDAYHRRLAVEREASNEGGVAESLVGIATVQYARFEYADALATYREAAAIQERLGDGNALGTTLTGTGNVQFIQADYEGALADYTRSRDLLHKAFNFGSEARAVEGLGRTSAARGDYAAALEAFGAVLTDARANGTESERGNATQNIGDVHFRLGNLEIARAAFDESRTHFEAAKDPPSIGRAWQAIAVTDLVATRYAAAEQEYTKSMAACTPINDRDCAATAMVGVAFAQASQEHYDDAIVTYKKAIDAFAALVRPGDAARAEVGLSLAYLGRKDYEQARLAATRARDAAAELRADDILWRATIAQGRAFRRLSASDKAVEVARDAVAIVQRMSEAALRNPSERVASDTASAYAFLAVMQAEAGDADAALVTFEMRRAHALRTLLALNEREIWRGMTPAEREDERALSVAVASVSAQLEQERQLPKPDMARIQALGLRLADAITARTAALQRIFDRLPDLRTWRGLTPPAGLADLLATVPPATAVVQLLIDDDDVVAVTIVPGDATPRVTAAVRAVRRQALAEKIAALTGAKLRDPIEWRRVAADVAALLPQQATAGLTAAGHALVIPDDVLWRVPFEALPAGTGFIGDAVSIRYVLSLSSLRAPLGAAGDPTSPLLAIAAPDLAADRIDRIRTTSPGWSPRSPDEARSEAQRAAGQFEGAVVLTGADASEAGLRARAPSANLLHVAAPFRINSASPLFSRIYLSPATAATESAASSRQGAKGAATDLSRRSAEGAAADLSRRSAEGAAADLSRRSAEGAESEAALDVREVFNLDAGARVAVFTDGTAAAMRDAASSWPVVQWAWRAAGVPQLLVARWPIDPAVAEDLLTEFYTRVKAGEPASAALHAAQARVRAREETRAPQSWAGWMLIGG